MATATMDQVSRSGRAGAARGSVRITDRSIGIDIERPVIGDGPAADDAATLWFAALGESFDGLVRWHRYEAVYSLLVKRMAQADAAGSMDVYTRVYDPLCQVAASYATVAGVRQCTAERFVEAAQACFERIPAVGRLLRDGAITTAWFQRVVEQTALVDDPELLAFIDAEIAHRLTTMGGLSARRVEDAVAAIVAEHDPDAVTLTREQAKASKKVVVNPLNDAASEVVVTTTPEEAILCKDSLDAVIEGICAHDPRTRGQLRSDAAVARMVGSDFVCGCGRDDCTAALSVQEVTSRCAKIVLHVVTRQETLDGASEEPAVMDGHGPISAAHVRDLAARPDAVCRPLNVADLAARMAQPGNPYRPTAALDTVARGLFGGCSWAGCDRPAWRCDLDHVTEFNHADPAAGGPTCLCNLSPKCKFHHGLKSHADGWLDDQIVDANGTVWTEITTPEGVTVRQQAANMWLLPEAGLIPCSHPDFAVGATRRGFRHAEDAPERSLSRVEAKHQYRMRRRAANRRAREAQEAQAAAMEAADGQPPF
ncbi:DUF222 domain-containing protein [Gordonia hydrophobica]|uniref:DUF222 domain-containing protein n=1 Tax=Gordonia hydrophobica TaxID=40516 RepID=A0ABZ2U195_9ACTN|nr:DUF222 domain-containing protein [Gordonia hydrophobica]MBM7367769.1 hypothetical protein [Gordonia hydrophobica]